MKTIVVTTPDNIEVEYRLAGAGSRVGAVVIDTAIQASIFAAVLIGAFGLLYDFSLNRLIVFAPRAANILAVVLALYFIIFFTYYLILEVIMKGHTPGKRVFGLRTIRRNGQPIGFIQSIIRNILRIFIDNMGVGILMMMFMKNHTRLGDMLAGTIVISENIDKYSTKSLVWKPFLETEEAAAVTERKYPMTTEEYEILKDYFARKEGFLENGRYAGVRIREYFAEKFAVDKTEVNLEFINEMMKENGGMYRD